MASASQAPQPPSDLAFVTTILGRLAILGALGLALYLGITSLMNGSIAGCTEGGGCHEVVASKWGYFLGIPVSLLGAGTYIVLLASDWSGCCPRVHALCRWMILLAVGWFVAVQAFILKEYCPWCCITHLLAVIGVACIWKKGTVPPSQVKILPLVGLAGVVARVRGQTEAQLVGVLLRPDTRHLERPEPPPRSRSTHTIGRGQAASSEAR